MKKLFACLLPLIILCFVMCGCEARDGEAEETVHTHRLGDWSVLSASTCTAEGLQERACACGYKERQAIPLLAHTPGSTVIEKEQKATCDTEGFRREVIRCTVCNTVLKSEDVVLPISHKAGEWVFDKKPTCQETGLRHKDCTLCGERLTEEVRPTTGHVADLAVKENEVPPTCDREGSFDQVRYCRSCGVEMSRSQITVPTQHQYVDRLCACGAIEYSKGLSYSLRGSSYAVTGMGSCTDELLLIPPEYLGLPVTTIGFGAFWNVYGHDFEVVIPASVTTIEAHTFSNACVKKVSFAEGSLLTSIGASAFSCSQIPSIVLPEGLKTIDEDAFSACRYLAEVTVPSTLERIGKDAFNFGTHVEKVFVSDLTKWCQIEFGNEYSNPASMAQMFLTDGTVVAHVNLPEGVEKISAYAFCRVWTIKTLTLPSTLKSVGAGAFKECNSISMHISDLASYCAVSFADRDAKPGGYLYLNGVLLQDLIIPDGVTEIGSYTFSCFYSTRSLYLPDDVLRAGVGAFRGCNLQEVRLSENLVEIPQEMLAANEMLSVVIPASVTRIGADAFQNCTHLESIEIPEAVNYIGAGAFKNCYDLTKVFFRCVTGWRLERNYSIDPSLLETPQRALQTVNDLDFSAWIRE